MNVDPSKKTKLTVDSIVQRDHTQSFSQIDNEIVMLSIKKAEYYAFNEIASMIWQLIDEPIPIRNIVASLLREYDVSKDMCFKHTIEYLQDLQSKQLIIIK